MIILARRGLGARLKLNSFIPEYSVTGSDLQTYFNAVMIPLSGLAEKYSALTSI
jgi:hypothetical protein